MKLKLYKSMIAIRTQVQSDQTSEDKVWYFQLRWNEVLTSPVACLPAGAPLLPLPATSAVNAVHLAAGGHCCLPVVPQSAAGALPAEQSRVV
jgi:hypothetical protein